MSQSIRLNLLLLLCLVYHSESSTISVTGIKGGRVTLSCDFEDREISDISLNSLSEIIPVCQEKNCSGRVFKEGSCDIIIKDLIFSDAGKYFLNIYYYNDQRELERRILKYHLHIHDEISVKTGEQLKMDVLLINADKVEKNSSGEWTEVWTRGHGVSSDRLTDRDGNLTISNFTVSDTGTYRVLDSEGEIWITVTVTGSKGKLDTDDDKPNGSEQRTLESWIIVVSVIGALLVLLVLVISAIIWKYKCQHRNTEHEPVPMDPSDMLNNVNGNSQSAFRDNRSTQDSINGFSCSLYLQERHSGSVGNTEEPLPALIKPNPMTK